MRNSSVRKRRQRRAAALLASAAATPLVASAANTDSFIGSSGQNWNTAANWNTGTVPATGDTVNITESPSSLFSISYDGSYTSSTAISSLTLDGNSSFGVVLNQATPGNDLFATNEFIGYSGIATFNQTAATNSLTTFTLNATLILGYNPTGQGTYLLGSNGALAANSIIVGQMGSGSLAQSGGTVNSTKIIVGQNWGSSGTYSLSAGSVTSTELHVGEYGPGGTFSAAVGSFVQSGGTAAFSNLYAGYYSGSNGVYSLSANGSLSVSVAEYVGFTGTGTFIQSGGTHSIEGDLLIGDYDNGNYVLSGGTLNCAQVWVQKGTFAQSGGTHAITTSLDVENYGPAGTYSLSGGMLSASTESVGQYSSGSFVQTGGNNTVLSGGNLIVGTASTGNGIYTLSGSGTMSVSGSAYVGGSAATAGGTGVLAVSGGAMTIANTLKVWNTSGTGVTLSGGSLTVGNIDLSGHPSVLNWTAGTLSLTNGASTLGSLSGSGTLSVGNLPGGTAASATVSSFSLASVSLNSTGTLAVAHSSTPPANSVNSLTIAAGGKLDLTNSTLLIHYTPGADPISTIIGYLQSDYDNGKWDGSGIISTTAAANASQTTGIGYADSADGVVAGLPADTIELTYAQYGDTALSGSVGFGDFTRFTQHYNTTTGGTWDTGDFNYDGSVNFTDFTLMTRTYNTTLGPTISPALGEAATSPAPEPTGAILLAIVGGSLVRRRRTSRT